MFLSYFEKELYTAYSSIHRYLSLNEQLLTYNETKEFFLSNFLLYHLISSHRRLYGLITIWWRKTFWDLITNPIVMNRFASCRNISHKIIIIAIYSTYKFSCLLGMHKISQISSREYHKYYQLTRVLIMFYTYYALIFIEKRYQNSFSINISHYGGLDQLIISQFLLCLSLAAQNKKQ